MSSAAVVGNMDSRRLSTDSVASSSLQRSRTWSEDVQKSWTMPVLPTETFQERLVRYKEYFSLKPDQIQYVSKQLARGLEIGLTNHKRADLGASLLPGSESLKMLDTSISQLPTGDEKGVYYSVDFSGSSIRAVRAKLEGSGRISTTEHREDLRAKATEYKKGYLDKNCGAMALFDAIASCVGYLMNKFGDSNKSGKPPVPVTFVVGFPIEQKGLRSASIVHWTKGFETGRVTADPVEGLDLAILLDMAFWRHDINAKCVAVTNDTAASLIACEYEKPKKLPACTVAYTCGVGVNGVYYETNASNNHYNGMLINTELGAFDNGLPVTVVDLEVDFADEGGQGRQMFEKMTGGGYLGELCRRLVVKVFQGDAPPLSWSKMSLPTAAAALCVSDQSEELSTVRRLLSGLWEWEMSHDTCKIVRDLFRLVFDRSAALSAVAIAALARKSGRLQPAMGGVTVCVDAALNSTHAWYSDSVRLHLKEILGETANFIRVYVMHDGPGKGGAVLAAMQSR